MIITQDLSKEFEKFLAVDGIDLNVGAGEVLALLGPNGSGKTTTVRMLSSILIPSRGWARVADFDVVEQPDQVRASVGVLTEHHGLYNRMSAFDYLDFFGQIYGLDQPTRSNRAERMLEKFGLIEFKKRKIGKFSRGMQQKLALARTLLHEPPVLLLDEPTSAMDPESARLVRDSIQDLRSSDRAIILCTHNLSEAEKLADKIAIIRYGKILAQGSPESLKQKLLGPAEYEVRWGAAEGIEEIVLPLGLVVNSSGENWLRFSPTDPDYQNPVILQSLLDQGITVVSLEKIPRSLEQIYLQVMNEPEQVLELSYAG